MKRTYTGGGCNGSSLKASIAAAAAAPSHSIPAGATWPFVTLEMTDKRVTFKMAQIKRSVSPSDISYVSLNRMGYLLFNSANPRKEFGFVSPRLNSITKELATRGFIFDDSVRRNMFIARISLFLQIAVPLVVFITVTFLSIIAPHGL